MSLRTPHYKPSPVPDVWKALHNYFMKWTPILINGWVCKGGEIRPKINCFGLKPLLPFPQVPHQPHPLTHQRIHMRILSGHLSLPKPQKWQNQTKKHVKTPAGQSISKTKAFFIKYSKLWVPVLIRISDVAPPSPPPKGILDLRSLSNRLVGGGGKHLEAWPLGDAAHQCFKKDGPASSTNRP